MENRETLQEMLKEIEKWEKEQKGLWFWERFSRIPFKIIDKLTPAFIQKKIGSLLDELGSFVQSGGKYLTSEKGVLKRLREQNNGINPETIEDIDKVPVAVMNAVSESIQKNRGNMATVQGATTGFGGVFTLAVDIPALLGLSLKTLQDIAVCYGYDPNDKKERAFIVKCLQFSSADVVGKKAILEDLALYRNGEYEYAAMASQLQGWREVVYTYRDNFGWKKLFQLVPIAGVFFGAFINKSMMQDVAEAGIMLYQKRRILERMNKKDELEV